MTPQPLYVATDGLGIERFGGTEVQWSLPDGAGPAPEVRAQPGSLLALRRPTSLLDCLDEVISLAEPTDIGAAIADTAVSEAAAGDVVAVLDPIERVAAARLVTRTRWNDAIAASFALDCVEHALGDAASVELPGGHRLGDVVADARHFVDTIGAGDERLGLVARLATARRLRKEGRVVGDIALGLSIEDVAKDLDATLDPAWTTAAAVEDAVLAVLEAVRHVARPRYVGLREDVAEAQQADITSHYEPIVVPSPWGPFVLGAEHDSSYTPASIAAREAALRARETVRARSGETAEAAERAFQASKLADALGEEAGS